MVAAILKPREANSHKGNHGHSLIIAGEKGKMGAAVIAAKACLRSGTGLLTMNVPQKERSILQTTIPEAMITMREDVKSDRPDFSAIAIGPGIGTSRLAQQLVTKTIKQSNHPLVLDADALNIVAANKKLLAYLKEETIITPHPKEFDRLFGEHNSIKDRMNSAINIAKQNKIVVVLKGHPTLVANSNTSFINTTGNAGLAKGGSGDALTGMITAFLAQGYKPFDAAILGVYIHGLAADIALNEQSMESMLITDVINCLGTAFKHIYA